jgi:hypothetical protein
MIYSRYRSAFLPVLTASVGLIVALLAGGCAGAPDDADAEASASQWAAQAGEGGDEPALEAAADDEHVDLDTHDEVLSHPAECQCGICTGGRTSSAAAR